MMGGIYFILYFIAFCIRRNGIFMFVARGICQTPYALLFMRSPRYNECIYPSSKVISSAAFPWRRKIDLLVLAQIICKFAGRWSLMINIRDIGDARLRVNGVDSS